MKPSLLVTRQLSFLASGREIFKNFSLSVHAGEFVAVLGRNGAGKSTFLNLVTGELEPSSGSIEIFGKPLRGWGLKDLAQRRAVMPQATALNFDYSVLEVVLLGRLPHQKQGSAELDRMIALDCLARVEMLDAKDGGYLQLSGGEQQRVHLARVLAQVHADAGIPRLLFLDEPTSSLDLRHQHQMLSLVNELKQSGVGVVAILHDLNLAAQYADRVAILSNGSLRALDTPNAAMTEENIYAAYNHSVMVSRHPLKDCPLII